MNSRMSQVEAVVRLCSGRHWTGSVLIHAWTLRWVMMMMRLDLCTFCLHSSWLDCIVMSYNFIISTLVLICPYWNSCSYLIHMTTPYNFCLTDQFLGSYCRFMPKFNFGNFAAGLLFLILQVIFIYFFIFSTQLLLLKTLWHWMAFYLLMCH